MGETGCRIQLNWQKVFREQITKPTDDVQVVGEIQDREDKLSAILHKYQSVFESGLGKYKGPEADFPISDGVTPKFLPAQPVPFARRQAVERELERLKEEEIIEEVRTS